MAPGPTMSDPSRTPLDEVADSDVADADANNRVHHHARVGDELPPAPNGEFTTLCGLRIRPRPGAARMPCCPMCALVMGRPCR